MKALRIFRMADAGGTTGGETSSGTLLSGATTGSESSTATTTTAAPPAWAWAKEDGTFSEGWQGKLTDGVKDHASLKAFTNLNDMARSYVELKGMMGKKLEAPRDDATPEQIAQWRKTVGAPEKLEGYYGDAKTLRPDVVPEGMWDANNEKAFLELAHKHHLPPAAVKDILGFYGNSIKSGLEAATAKEAEVLAGETTKLQTEWGKDFDANLNLAKRVALTVGLEPDNAIFTNADTVKAFAKMGKFFSEDKLVKGDGGGFSSGVEDRIRDIQDLKSTSQIARDYRGENGPDKQEAARKELHSLLDAREALKKQR